MLVIRLSRTGRSKIPTYRIVVAEKSAAVKGRYHEAVGYFNPASETPKPTYDRERIQYWISQGARPSETLARLLAKEGFAGMEKFYDVNKKYQKKSKKGEAGETGEAGEVGEKGEAGEAKKAKGAEAPVAQGKPAEEAPASETETKKA